MMADLQRDGERREAALRKDMYEMQRNTARMVLALEDSLRVAKMDIMSLNNRVSNMERQIPVIYQRLDELQGR